MTCHNRRDTTLRCLRALFAQEGLPPEVEMEMYLVDDGSTDGSGEAERCQFPQVRVIPEDGELFWAGGMRMSWREAAQVTPDAYLWLNDDTTLFPDALAVLMQNLGGRSDRVICGAVQSALNGDLTYSGYLLKKRNADIRAINPNGSMQPCDFFNGNIVLIPRKAYEIVGNLDLMFHHGLGDFDWGLRAKKKGVASFVSSRIVGYCEKNSTISTWMDPNISLGKRLNVFLSPKGPDAWKLFRFEARHRSISIALFHLFSTFWRLLSPSNTGRNHVGT
jgi:GT2 family glycosyltransferase